MYDESCSFGMSAQTALAVWCPSIDHLLFIGRGRSHVLYVQGGEETR